MLHLFVKLSAGGSLSTVGIKGKKKTTLQKGAKTGKEGGMRLTPIGRFLSGG